MSTTLYGGLTDQEIAEAFTDLLVDTGFDQIPWSALYEAASDLHEDMPWAMLSCLGLPDNIPGRHVITRDDINNAFSRMPVGCQAHFYASRWNILAQAHDIHAKNCGDQPYWAEAKERHLEAAELCRANEKANRNGTIIPVSL